jgi:hypothetical protein
MGHIVQMSWWGNRLSSVDFHTVQPIEVIDMAVSRRLAAVELWVRPQWSPYEIFDGYCDTGTGFSRSTSVLKYKHISEIRKVNALTSHKGLYMAVLAVFSLENRPWRRWPQISREKLKWHSCMINTSYGNLSSLLFTLHIILVLFFSLIYVFFSYLFSVQSRDWQFSWLTVFVMSLGRAHIKL